MFHLIPAPLHRALLRIAHRLRYLWWGLRRPTFEGVSIIARDAEGRILLVRHSYGAPIWALPGGGIRKGERPDETAAREFAEELGCRLLDLRAVGTREEPINGATNIVHVFAAETVGEPTVDGRELLEARFFDPADLPRRSCRRLRARLALLKD